MIIVGGLLAYELFVYENLDRARAESALHWRNIATQLDNDYKQIAAMQSSDQQTDPAWWNEFRYQVDQFRTATNMEDQLSVARNLEVQLQGNQAIRLNLPQMADQVRQEIDKLNTSLMTEHAIQHSLAGRVVQFFIRHPIRKTWDHVR